MRVSAHLIHISTLNCKDEINFDEPFIIIKKEKEKQQRERERVRTELEWLYHYDDDDDDDRQ